MRLIYEFDPLQHHGWFVISEEDLKLHNIIFLMNCFLTPKVIYPIKDLSFDIHLPSHVDFEKPLFDLITSLKRKLNCLITHVPITNLNHSLVRL